MMGKSDGKRNVFREDMIHVGAGFVAKERLHVVGALSGLGPHLAKWDPHNVFVEATLQDRGRREQRVTLRTTLPGWPPLVAVVENVNIVRALEEAKHELVRQIEHQKATHEPVTSPRRRTATIRHPGATESVQQLASRGGTTRWS
jgi:hypothetical protein